MHKKIPMMGLNFLNKKHGKYLYDDENLQRYSKKI